MTPVQLDLDMWPWERRELMAPVDEFNPCGYWEASKERFPHDKTNWRRLMLDVIASHKLYYT